LPESFKGKSQVLKVLCFFRKLLVKYCKIKLVVLTTNALIIGSEMLIDLYHTAAILARIERFCPASPTPRTTRTIVLTGKKKKLRLYSPGTTT
jgi:hypothetical protein